MRVPLNYATGGDFADNFDLPNRYLGDWDASLGVETVAGVTDIYVTLAPSSNQWQGPNNGNYSNAANWVTGVPNAVGIKAMFAGLGTPPTVNLDINPKVGKIVFNNATSYTISSSNSSRFILNAGAGVPAEIDDNGGNHTIAVGILMAKDTTFVVTGANDTLIMSGVINGASNTITENGPGKLLLSADNVFGSTAGGAIVLGGTLQLDGTNTYVGATTATNGTVAAAIIKDFGVASSIGKPATNSASNLVLDTSTLKYTGTAATSTNRGITLANASAIDTPLNLAINGPAVMGTVSGPAVTLNTPGAGTVTLGGQITSVVGGSFTKTGTGTLTYASTAAGVVSTIASAGGAAYVIQNGNVTIAGPDNTTQYNVPNGDLTVGAETLNNPLSLTVSAGTVNVGGTFSLGAGNLGTSTLTMTGGAINSALVWLGFSATSPYPGTQNIYLSGSSSLSSSSDIWTGQNTGSNTTISIIDSAQMSGSRWMSIGLNGTSTVTVNGTAQSCRRQPI